MDKNGTRGGKGYEPDPIDIKEDYTALYLAYTQLKNQFEQAEKESAELKASSPNDKQLLLAKVAELKRTEKALEEVKAEWEEAKAEWEKVKADLETRNDELQKHNDCLTQKNATLTKQLISHRPLLATADSTKEKAARESSSSNKDGICDSKLKEAEGKITTLESELKEAKEKITALESDNPYYVFIWGHLWETRTLFIWGHAWKGILALLDVVAIWWFAYSSLEMVTAAAVGLMVFLTLANVLIIGMRAFCCLYKSRGKDFNIVILIVNIIGSVFLAVVILLTILAFGVGL